LDGIDFIIADPGTFEVVKSEPNFSSTSQDFPYHTYTFEKEIKPGETLEVTLELEAKEKGSHPLTVGVCMNNPFSCQGYEFDMFVR
jgi:hypothetical protein